MKKLAVVASGWHFPITFYEQITRQKIPAGWEVDLFVISHRDPSFSEKEKVETLARMGYTRRELYDRLMYRKVATISEIEAMGWHYELHPNTIGDLGCSNQWLENHDYKKYDKFLFTHDDNFILTDQVFEDILPQNDWLILTNTTVTPKGDCDSGSIYPKNSHCVDHSNSTLVKCWIIWVENSICQKQNLQEWGRQVATVHYQT